MKIPWFNMAILPFILLRINLPLAKCIQVIDCFCCDSDSSSHLGDGMGCALPNLTFSFLCFVCFFFLNSVYCLSSCDSIST